MTIALVWFRQDLRLRDNPAFIAACTHHEVVIPLYIYDKTSSALGRAQQWWLHHSLLSLSDSLQSYPLQLILKQGNPLAIIAELCQQHSVDAVYWNRCYEPSAIARDTDIKSTLGQKGIVVKSTNGSLLNEPWSIQNKSGGYFKVFTPYWKHCLQTITVPPQLTITRQPKAISVASEHLDEWCLLPKNPNWAQQFPDYWQPGEDGAQKKLTEFVAKHLNGYKTNRNLPAQSATSKLSPHLHFGEISPWAIWHALSKARANPGCDMASAEHFLAELGWREFSYHLLYHVPSLPQANFKQEFDSFPWQTADDLLHCWQKGTTGFPIVDAGMRELWATGYMHNRVRMIVASFLTKDLLIDWRFGAEWFLDTLVDADLASNSASWQWVAGCGADAAPYFRIFNPLLQSEKFDPNGAYIRQWVPELAHLDKKQIHQPWSPDGKSLVAHHSYHRPIVDHHEARKRALEHYQFIRQKE